MSQQLHHPNRSTLYRFKLDKMMGKGGSGTVYRGIDQKTGEAVALKLFHSTFFTNKAHIWEVQRSVKQLKKLDHPNVARVFEFLSGDEGEVLVQEYIDGPDLNWYVTNRKWDLQERLVVAAQMCNGLQYIHENDIVHHDIKPSNILFTRKGQVKITDYTLARSRILAFLNSGVSELITPMFVAPEIIKKEKASFASDLYALGITFYLVFTQQYPFNVDTVQKLYYCHLHVSPDHPSIIHHKCPAGLGDIILRLMEKKPEKRYENCDQVRIALSNIGVSRI